MSVTTEKTEDNICTCCILDRKEMQQYPRKLKPLLRSTPVRHLMVSLCEYCDGPAYALGRRKNNIWFDPDILDEEDE